MKQSLLLTIIFSFCVINIMAQSPKGKESGRSRIPRIPSSGTIHFNYDTAGNQIKRYSQHAKSAVEKEVVAENVIEEDEKLEKSSLLEYFPNPVENQLTLTWVKSLNTNVKTIQIYSLNSKIIENISIKKNTQQHIMSLENLASGIYIVKVSFDNGKQESFKIIKK